MPWNTHPSRGGLDLLEEAVLVRHHSTRRSDCVHGLAEDATWGVGWVADDDRLLRKRCALNGEHEHRNEKGEECELHLDDL